MMYFGMMRTKKSIPIYFQVWRDALCSIKKNNPKDYKWMSIVFISMGNALNLLSLCILLHALFDIPILVFNYYKIHITDIKQFDSLIKFCIQFFLLPFLINYYCVFYKKKDIALLDDMAEIGCRGRLFASYIIGTILVLVFVIFLSFMMQ